MSEIDRSPRAGIEARRAVTIQRTRDDVYRLLRRLDNLPKFMEHVTEVRVDDERTSHWAIKEGPVTLHWTAELVEDVPGRRLAWRSRPGGAVTQHGEIELRDAPGGRGTEVHLCVSYRPPLASITPAPLRALLRRYTSAQLGVELGRLRQLLEAGEIAIGAPRVPEKSDTAAALEVAAMIAPLPAHTAAQQTRGGF
jgi:uncharacterized membrane protein